MVVAVEPGHADSFMDFSPHDLVQCTVSVNSIQIYNVLQNMAKAIQLTNRNLETLETKLAGLNQDSRQMRTETEQKLHEHSTKLHAKIDKLQNDAYRDLEYMKTQKDQKTIRVIESIKILEQRTDEMQNSLEARITSVETHSTQTDKALEAKLTGESQDLRALIDALPKPLEATLDKHSETLQRHNERLTDTTQCTDALWCALGFEKERLMELCTPEAETRKRAYVSGTQHFKALADSAETEKQRMGAKLDHIHKRIGRAEQTLLFTATTEDLDKVQKAIDISGLQKQVQEHWGKVQELVEVTTCTDRSLSLGLGKKAEKAHVETLQADVETMFRKVKDMVSPESNAWQALVERVEQLDTYVQKMDRRKLGKAEFNSFRQQRPGSPASGDPSLGSGLYPADEPRFNDTVGALKEGVANGSLDREALVELFESGIMSSDAMQRLKASLTTDPPEGVRDPAGEQLPPLADQYPAPELLAQLLTTPGAVLQGFEPDAPKDETYVRQQTDHWATVLRGLRARRSLGLQPTTQPVAIPVADVESSATVRCLSCHQPTRSSQAPGMSAPPLAPGSVLVMPSPGIGDSQVTQATSMHSGTSTLDRTVNGVQPYRSKLQEYYQWADDQEAAARGPRAGPPPDTLALLPTSTSVASVGAAVAGGTKTERQATISRKLRTNLVGSDKRLYHGLSTLPKKRLADT